MALENINIVREQDGNVHRIKSGGMIAIDPGGGLCGAVKLIGANYTVPAVESGTHYIATAADVVFTLPATANGLRYSFSVAAAGLSSGTGLSVSPAAADKIMGNGFTAADDKDAINTGATDRDGDCIEIVGDGADGWVVVGVTGTWARQA